MSLFLTHVLLILKLTCTLFIFILLISFIHVDFSVFCGSAGRVLGVLRIPLSEDILLNVSMFYLM